nr:SPRY domain-containing SOCS box protein 3-like [Cherax quadricarinatus]XP_053646040.1 SPRY domain-containing SOCS box protein 3-like [Cherax quadricarinatus]XP_053646041.1 SPRY domain-containing SOCS box protein 3-like [Cherax quadricarinatus]XP_053646042.1 SPRY domain-containing SOCS box protein 3-like [Cherax quadricarinatus]
MIGRMLRDASSTHGPYVGAQSNSFCQHTDMEPIMCGCGEEEKDFAWVWSTREEGGQAGSILLASGDRQIIFNPEYSSGTAAIRGNETLPSGYHHYWELKMTSAVYGTDIMVGVCTPKCDLKHGIHRFCSLLGRDEESWGYSYTGTIRHAAKFRQYGPRWGKGSIVGIHLDSWRGTLEFFLNRKPLGIAFSGLQNIELYPIVTSTSAHSGMKLVTSCTFSANLQFLASEVVFKHMREKMRVDPENLPLPPGLRSFVANNYWPLLRSVGLENEDNKNEEPKWSKSSTKHPYEDAQQEDRLYKRFCSRPLHHRSHSASSTDTYSDGSSSPSLHSYMTDFSPEFCITLSQPPPALSSMENCSGVAPSVEPSVSGTDVCSLTLTPDTSESCRHPPSTSDS